MDLCDILNCYSTFIIKLGFTSKLAAQIWKDRDLPIKQRTFRTILAHHSQLPPPELAPNLTNLHELPFTSYNIRGESFHEEIFIREIRENIVARIFFYGM